MPGYAPIARFGVPIVGVAATSLSLPPFGTLRVDRAAGILLPPLVVPSPIGDVTLPIAVPTDASLYGVTLVAQWLVVDPLRGGRFTNALHERIR